MTNSPWSLWSEVTTNKHDSITLTLTLLIFLAITLAISWYKSRNLPPGPPGPRGLPVVGYLPFLNPNLHHGFTKLAQRYGSIFKLKLGCKNLIIISSPELAKAVLREQDDIFANRDPPVAALVLTYGGQNIVWSNNNSYWRNLRKVLVHEVLINKNLEASRMIRRDEARRTVSHVYHMIGSEVDVTRIVFFMLIGVVMNMLWGEISSVVEEHLREVISKMVELLGTPNMSDFFPVISRFDLQGVEREMKKQLKFMDAFYETIIGERLRLNAIKLHEEELVVDQEGRKDILQILLDLKDQNTATSFNITQIKALLMDIIAGGTDVTSTTIIWTMTELLQNPGVMKKVQGELEEVVGLNNIVEEFHLPKLHQLNAAIKETFRLHPPIPLLIARSPNQSCEIGGYTIPKGSNVYLNVWSIHRDPKYWENPEDFNHNRFLNPKGTIKSNYNENNFSFLPFGSGRRMCPGVPLGEKMLVYILASLLHSFEWTLPHDKEHDISDEFGIVLKKIKPLIAIPTPRLSDKNLYM